MYAIPLAVMIAMIAISAAASAQRSPPAKPVSVDRLMKDAFKSAAPDWQARITQDETQKACSATRNNPPPQLAQAIRKRERALIRYPADGVLMGDWKRGEAVAHSGYGLRYTDDPPRQPTGGNCYACHQMDKAEVSFGTLGPSLVGYGKIRNFGAPFEKAAYEHIYNPQAGQPCATMPRFGTNKVLSIEQIKDLVAYLMSPESPVNK